LQEQLNLAKALRKYQFGYGIARLDTSRLSGPFKFRRYRGLMGELGQSDLPPEGSRRHKFRKGFGMIDAVLLYGMIYPAAGVAVLSVIWLVVRGRVPDRVLWIVTGVGVVASVVRLVYLYRSGVLGIDYRIFYEVGRDLRAGVSPYLPSRFACHPFLNPPSTFPFFALIAMPPYPTSLAVWVLANSVMAFALVWQARRTLFMQDGRSPSGLSHAELGALAAAFGLSDACTAMIQLGQLSLLVTVLILLALEFQGRQMPARAGAALGVATMKVGTMLPFLLLFCRKQDRRSWIVLVATTATLILLGGRAPRILEDVRSMLHYIGEFSKPGQTNDISYQGPYNEWILGFDHVAYRLGMRDRTALAVFQFVALGLIGGWLAWEVIACRVSRAQGIALLSLYSVIFLYHRLYDAVMIVPALVYAVDQAKSQRGRNRLLFAGASVSMLMLLYMRRKTLATLTDWVMAHRGAAASLIETLILPHAVWLILLSIVLLRAGMADAKRSTRRAI
jgi:Glycosyltransferase family 87